MRLNFLPIICLLIFLPSATVISQHEDDQADFITQLDSMIQSTFLQFDRRLGTYIFREPSSDSTESVDEASGVLRPYQADHRSSRLSLTSRLPSNTLLGNPIDNVANNVKVRHNRVEGLYLGLGRARREGRDRKASFYGFAGYGFSSHRWRYMAGLARYFGSFRNQIAFDIEGHSVTDSPDDWMMSEGENTLSSIMFREDYRDYFGRTGFSVSTGFTQRWDMGRVNVRIMYRLDEHESLHKMTDWAIFGGGRSFRDNLSASEGTMKSIGAAIEAEGFARGRSINGWSMALSGEFAGPAGDFSFSRFDVDLRRYHRLSSHEHFNTRVRVGTSAGELPPQKLFAIGGIGTLPGFSLREFTGNAMLLTNFEYTANLALFSRSGTAPSRVLKNVSFILFADAGFIPASGNTPEGSHAFQGSRGFEALSLSTLKSDWGVGIGSSDGKIRFALAWRTDTAGPAKAFIRLERPF